MAMRKGEVVKVERIESGLYKVTYPDGTSLVGIAATTAIALMRAVFWEEANGDA